MPNNWIARPLLTSQTEIATSTGVKLHDLIPCDQGAGVLVDPQTHPVLYSKLKEVPDMPTPTGSPHPWKIIADAT